jgi:hypothetical protein
MLPVWVYLVWAAVIAGLAFAIGQIVPGAGVPFALVASLVSVALAVRRKGQLGDGGVS